MALLKGLRTTRSDDKKAISKSKSTTKVNPKLKGNNMQIMIDLANKKLEKYKDQYMIITAPDSLDEYFARAVENGYMAFDTETTGLDFYNMDIAGICIYSEGLLPAYVPINHESYVTGIRSANQLSEKQVADSLNSYKDDIKFIMHNAKFDIRVCKHTLGVDLDCYWDTMLAAYCIDEEESHGLKEQHLKYCKSQDTEALKIDNLFDGVTFTKLPISTAYLYAAGDAIKTWELWEHQKEVFETKEYKDVYPVFWDIEMKVLPVVIDMEERGVVLDKEYANKLSIEYNSRLDEARKKANLTLEMYQEQIDNYRMSHTDNKLSDPINLKSPTQLAILFYDILKLASPDKKSPRGTGEDIMKHFAKGKHKNLCEVILEIRGLEKLIGTYIDKMPEVVQKDGRIHCSFNQYGAKTGRFSSNNPNLQNIPSHNKDIRKMFKAPDGYYMMSVDFSQQEMKVCASLAESKMMLDAFEQGRDIYSTIAALAYNTTYEDCKEFRPDGTTNKEGKERRTQAKSICLGIMYGRGIPSIAEQLGVSTKKAQEIYDKVLSAFPDLARFDKESKQMAKDIGYVTTAYGRRRHLKDMQLKPYEFKLKDGKPMDFDPLNFTQNDISFEVPEKTKKEYIKRLDKAFGFKAKQQIKDEALSRGIVIKDNGGFIAQAERQCVNARVQGSSADITKVAMIGIFNDEHLRQLGCHLIMQVHDEVIVEFPKENVKEVRERIIDIMSNSSVDKIGLKMNVDCEITECWYGGAIEDWMWDMDEIAKRGL